MILFSRQGTGFWENQRFDTFQEIFVSPKSVNSPKNELDKIRYHKGKVRLQKWFHAIADKDRKKISRDIVNIVLQVIDL